MRFVSMPLRNLMRRPLRSSLTALGIAVAMAGFILLVGVSRALETAWVNSLHERGTHMMAVRKGVVEILTASLDEGLGDEIRTMAGVSDVAGELVDLASLETGQPVLVIGWPSDSYLWRALRVQEGRLPRDDETHSVVLGQATADALHKAPGDSLRLRRRSFHVAGTFVQSGVLGNHTMILPLTVLQDVMHRPGTVTEFNIRLVRPDDPSDVDSVQARLARAFPDLLFTETSKIADENDILRLFRAASWSTSTIALVIALVVVLNTLLMAVTERVREIGILLAVGWSAPRILAMIVLEGLALVVLGSLIGTLLGLGGLHWLSSFSPVRGFLEPHVTARMILEVTVVALLIGMLASLYPAWRAVRLNAVEALAYE